MLALILAPIFEFQQISFKSYNRYHFWEWKSIAILCMICQTSCNVNTNIIVVTWRLSFHDVQLNWFMWVLIAKYHRYSMSYVNINLSTFLDDRLLIKSENLAFKCNNWWIRRFTEGFLWIPINPWLSSIKSIMVFFLHFDSLFYWEIYSRKEIMHTTNQQNYDLLR